MPYKFPTIEIVKSLAQLLYGNHTPNAPSPVTRLVSKIFATLEFLNSNN